MNFLSDGTAFASPEVLQRMARHAPRIAEVFEGDPITRALRARVAEVFERDVDAFPVVTGTASNSLALAALTRPYGAVLCHHDAHIDTDECGGPMMFTGGAKLIGVEGNHGKVDPRALKETLSNTRFGVVHRVQPMALSLTQSTEAGTVYTQQEMVELIDIAKRHGLRVHVDGARFANALEVNRCTPAELSWMAGVDILCLGATKNGAIAAECVVVFDRTLTEHLRFLVKRSGHFMAKSCLVSTQLDAYLTDDLWLRNARHANAFGRKLAAALRRFPEVQFVNPPEANQVFVTMPDGLLDFLVGAGVRFNVDWRTHPVRHHRFSASFVTDDDEIGELSKLAEQWLSIGRAPR